MVLCGLRGGVANGCCCGVAPCCSISFAALSYTHNANTHPNTNTGTADTHTPTQGFSAVAVALSSYFRGARPQPPFRDVAAVAVALPPAQELEASTRSGVATQSAVLTMLLSWRLDVVAVGGAGCPPHCFGGWLFDFLQLVLQHFGPHGNAVTRKVHTVGRLPPRTQRTHTLSLPGASLSFGCCRGWWWRREEGEGEGGEEKGNDPHELRALSSSLAVQQASSSRGSVLHGASPFLFLTPFPRNPISHFSGFRISGARSPSHSECLWERARAYTDAPCVWLSAPSWFSSAPKFNLTFFEISYFGRALLRPLQVSLGARARLHRRPKCLAKRAPPPWRSFSPCRARTSQATPSAFGSARALAGSPKCLWERARAYADASSVWLSARLPSGAHLPGHAKCLWERARACRVAPSAFGSARALAGSLQTSGGARAPLLGRFPACFCWAPLPALIGTSHLRLGPRFRLHPLAGIGGTLLLGVLGALLGLGVALLYLGLLPLLGGGALAHSAGSHRDPLCLPASPGWHSFPVRHPLWQFFGVFRNSKNSGIFRGSRRGERRFTSGLLRRPPATSPFYTGCSPRNTQTGCHTFQADAASA